MYCVIYTDVLGTLGAVLVVVPSGIHTIQARKPLYGSCFQVWRGSGERLDEGGMLAASFDVKGAGVMKSTIRKERVRMEAMLGCDLQRG